MRFWKDSRDAALLCAALLSFASAAGQSLQHRPPATPPPPPVDQTPAKPVEDRSDVLAAGTTLQVEIVRFYPMKQGEAIEGHLVYPLYAGGKLVVSENTPVHGIIAQLEPNAMERWHGRLLGDFTPFHTARVQFDRILLPGGVLPIQTDDALAGAPLVRLSTPGVRPRQGLIAKEWALAKARLHEQVALFTDPGLGDRARQLLYHQLPYHPERIPAHTSWTFELTAPVDLPREGGTLPATPAPKPVAPGSSEIWTVNAVLKAEVSSATAKPGDPVQALVVEPVFDKDGHLAVPQGSMLIGKVTTAKAARSLGRSGKLRFNFQQVRFPQGEGMPAENHPVDGALAGATTQGEQGLKLDAEGTITSKSQSSVIAPLLLTMLAGRALDQDGNLTVQTGVASNGFGLVGRVVGMASGNRNLAAGLGFYAAGLSLYQNFLRPGRDVIFPKDTRVEIETTPLRAPALKPDIH